PFEGEEIRRGPYVVTGTNNGPEGTVVIQLVSSSPSGDTVVLTDSGTATGTGDPDRLYPWRGAIDTAAGAPGTCPPVPSDDHPSGGAEGSGPAQDTRTVVITP